MNQQNEIILLEELISIVKNKGYTKTINILKKNNTSVFELDNPYDKFVVNLIADTFEINSNDLLQSRYSRGNMKYAIGFCVYYLYQEKTLGYIGKNIFKDKNLTLLSRYRQMIFELTKPSPLIVTAPVSFTTFTSCILVCFSNAVLIDFTHPSHLIFFKLNLIVLMIISLY